MHCLCISLSQRKTSIYTFDPLDVGGWLDFKMHIKSSSLANVIVMNADRRTTLIFELALPFL